MTLPELYNEAPIAISELIPPPPPPLATGNSKNPSAPYGNSVVHEALSNGTITESISAVMNASTIHAVPEAEKTAFVNYINQVLAKDPVLVDKLPLDPSTDQIFTAVQDGILLCKMLNASVPDTIDETKLIVKFNDRSRTYHQLMNHLLCLDGSKRIGAKVINVGPEDLAAGKPYLVFGLLWQIIKIGLLKDVSVDKHPELAGLMDANSEPIPPEELLMKWINWHLQRSGSDLRINNFSNDLKNSEVYAYLMNRLNPEICSLDILSNDNMLERARDVLANAERLGIKTFVTAEDIVNGNDKLNLAFAASMFNKSIKMVPLADQLQQENVMLHTENVELKTIVTVMERSLEDLSKEKETLASEIEALSVEKKKMNDAVARLKEEREELAIKIKKIFDVNEQLTNHIHAIDSEKKALNQTKEMLENDFDRLHGTLQQTLDELRREKLSLQSSELSGALLASDLEDLRNRHAKMEYLIEHLKLERMRSDMHVERLRVLYGSFPSTEALSEAIYRSLKLENIAQTATKTGFLTKKARSSSNWKYRYFVLRDNFLFYYKSDKDPSATPLGAIRVDDASLRFADNPTKTDLKDQFVLCLEIPNNNGAVKENQFFVAGEQAELEVWKTQIQQAAGWWTKKSSVSTIKRAQVGK